MCKIELVYLNLDTYSLILEQILGNLIPFAAFKLTSWTIEQEKSSQENMSAQLLYTNQTLKTSRYEIKDICGANDCQDPVIVNEYMSNYQPPNKLSFYILMGILIAIQIIATLLHALFSPSHSEIATSISVDNKVDSLKGKNNNSYIQDSPDDDDDERKDIEAIHKTIPDGIVFKNNCDNQISNNNKGNNEDGINSQTTDQKSRRSEKLKIAMIWLKSNLAFFFQPGQLLLIGISFYMGMTISFAMGEITRAYIACVFGMTEIGLVMASYGTSCFLCSVVAGFISAKFGRPACVALATIMSYALQLFYIMWVPNENSNIGIIYGVLVVAGIADTMMLSIVVEVQMIHFPNAGNKPTTSWVGWSGLAYIVQFSWSTSLCVKHKIYAMTGLLTFAAITYGIAEYRHMKKNKANREKSCAIHTMS